MATVKIDGKDYDVDSLSDDAKKQLVSLQFVQSEISKLEGQIAVFKTAQAAYTKVLQSELEGK